MQLDIESILHISVESEAASLWIVGDSVIEAHSHLDSLNDCVFGNIVVSGIHKALGPWPSILRRPNGSP